MQDPLTPTDDLEFGLPDDFIATLKLKAQSPPKAKAPLKVKDLFQFYKLPTRVAEDVGKLADEHGTPAPLLVLLALYKAWFASFQTNPVKLTTYSLRTFGVTRDQKRRALQLLETTGHITVFREARKNPQVALNWLPRSK
jgi:hypothetical protein